MELSRCFFDRNVVEVARDLIGVTLLFHGLGGVIVETEAYAADDEASHSFGGRTSKNAAMFDPSGHAYIYRSYGVHWCLNFVCEPGSAVLVRALEPTIGIEPMQERRGRRKLSLLCAGPGRLCQALGVSIAQNALPLDEAPFQLLPPVGTPPISVGRRIGITRAVDLPWRFALTGSRFLSRRMPES